MNISLGSKGPIMRPLQRVIAQTPFAGMGLKLGLFGLVTFLTCSYSILVQLSKVDGKTYAYNPLTVTFCAELAKLVISMVLYYSDSNYNRETSPRLTLQGVATYSVPGFIYLVNNNLAFAALHYLSPPVYQLLANMKIFTTALLFRVVIRRTLTNHQWAAVLLLMLGCMVPELNAIQDNDSEDSLLITGFVLMIVVSTLSGAAGVYTEYMLKKSDHSMHFKNMQLYLCGVVFTGIAITVVSTGPVQKGEPFFQGYDWMTWLVVLNLALNGMAISFIMNYADNIIKLYAGAVAMFLSMILSLALFDFAFNPHLVMGAGLVCISLYVYNIGEHPQR